MFVRIHTVRRSLFKCVEGYRPSCMFAADLSMAAILSTRNQIDASSLQKPTYDDLVRKVSALEEELANVRRGRYVVDLPTGGDRDGQSDLMEAICSKWSVDVAKDKSDIGEQSSSENLMNSGLSLLYSVKDRKHVLSLGSYGYRRSSQVHSETVKKHIVETGSDYNPDFRHAWLIISSANLLYRLCCLFQNLPVDITGPSGYKVVWTAYVKHKASGKVFGFSEWKGAALYRMPTRELEDEWVDGWIELLDLLCSDHCPHPYDGVVAGSIA